MFTSTSEHTPFLHQVAGHNTDTVYFRSYRRRLSRPRRFVSSSHIHASDLDDTTNSDEQDCWSGSESDTPSDCEDTLQMHVSTVLKPLPSSTKGLRERCFYEYLNSALRARRMDVEWLRFFPRYYGALYAVQKDDQTSALLPAAPLTSLEPFSSDPALPISSTVLRKDEVPNAVILESTASSSPESNIQSTSSIDCEPAANYLHLEDLTACYSKPSLIDVKIGLHSYDPFECALGAEKKREKVRRENEKCPSQLQTGFRICGARVWSWRENNCEAGDEGATNEIDGESVGEELLAAQQDIEGDYKVFDRYWCRFISLDDIEQPFWIFFGHTPSSSSPFSPSANNSDEEAEQLRESLSPASTQFTPSPLALRNARRFIPSFLDRLSHLHKLCTHNPKWRFYASSLLLCYETPNWNGKNSQLEERRPSILSGVHMIDFGHAYPMHMVPPIIGENGTVVHPSSTSAETKIDANYLHGIQSLMNLFRKMLQRATIDEADPDVLREEKSKQSTHPHHHRKKTKRIHSRARRKKNERRENDIMPSEGNFAPGNPSHCIPRRFSSLLSKFIVDRSIVEGQVNSLLYEASQNPHVYLKCMPQLRLSTLPSQMRKQQLEIIASQPPPSAPSSLCYSNGTTHRCSNRSLEDSSLHSFLQSRSNLNVLWKLKLELANRFDDGVNTSFERPECTIEDGHELGGLEAIDHTDNSNAASNKPKHPRTQEWRQKLIAEQQLRQSRPGLRNFA